MINLKKVFLGHLFVFLVVFNYIATNAETYYVDSVKGNDDNPGTSIDSPWRSIAKLNSFYFLPSDSILFKRGSVWREELSIKSSGNSNRYITFSSYGEGDKPKILGSESLDYWTEVKSNIWKADLGVKGNWIWFVDIDSIYWGINKKSLNEINSEYNFYIDSTFVYIYSLRNPSEEFKSIELSVREFGIISGWYDKGTENIKVENLELLFTKNAGIRVVGGNNWVIENCVSHHNGATDESDGQGIQYEGENGLFTKNILYENGQHGFYLSAFGNSPVTNNVIEHSTIYDNYHTGIDVMNNGDSLQALMNTIIRYNKVFDNKTFNGREVGIQFYAFNGGKIKNVKVYYNIIFNIKGIGISVQDNSDSVLIYNNTVYQPESTCFTLENDSCYVELINNIGRGDNYYAVLFVHNPQNKIIDYNCWYRKEGNLIWVAGKYYSDWENYITETGFDKNGINLNPLLNEETLEPENNSPCINIGKFLGLKQDFWGNKIVTEKVDIGACECY